MTRHRFDSQRGFTVSEVVLVAVFIVGLLMVAVLSVRGINRDNAVSDCQTELRSLKLAVGQFESTNGVYPADRDELLEADIEVPEQEIWNFETNGPDEAPDYVRAGGGSC